MRKDIQQYDNLFNSKNKNIKILLDHFMMILKENETDIKYINNLENFEKLNQKRFIQLKTI